MDTINHPGWPGALEVPGAPYPFEVLDLGNGQVFVYLPNGRDDVPKVIAFAHKSPHLFKKFFPGVNIDEVIAGDYSWFEEPDMDTHDSSAATAVTPVPAVDGAVVAADGAGAAAVSEPDLSLYVALTVRQALVAGLIGLAPTYRADFIRRAMADRERFFVFSPFKFIPADPHRLTGDAYRAFLASQGLPPYIPPTSFRDGFAPRRRPARTPHTAAKVNVLGGDYLWKLARDPSDLDIIYSTTASTIAPERGRVYDFDELFPDSDAPSPQLSLDSSPSRASDTMWGSSSTVGTPWPSSSQDSALDFGKDM